MIILSNSIKGTLAQENHANTPSVGCSHGFEELMTQDVAAQAGPFGIRANCVAPETILTETNQRLIPQEQQKALVEMHPLRRLGILRTSPTRLSFLPLTKRAG